MCIKLLLIYLLLLLNCYSLAVLFYVHVRLSHILLNTVTVTVTVTNEQVQINSGVKRHRKDTTTMSYLLVSDGLCHLMELIDQRRVPRL